MKKQFGKYAVLDKVKHVFEREPDWWWMIKPPTAADELAVARVLSTDRSRIELDGTRTVLLPMTLEVAMREVAVTFGGTNIPMSDDDPTPILKEGASWEQVEEMLKFMPRDMLIELWIAVGEAVPGWGPAKPKQKPEEKSEEDSEPKN
jgi:hypothetical protein